VKGSYFLEVIITAAAMAASVNPLSVRSPSLACSRSLAAMRFRASWLAISRKAFTSSIESHLQPFVRRSHLSSFRCAFRRKLRGAQPAFGAATPTDG
jgi:hypothetical protein